MTTAAAEHERSAASRPPARCAVLTVSDSRTPRTDRSGPLAARLLADCGHEVVDRDVVPDEPAAIRRRLEAWLADPGVDAVVTTGGTGLGPRDVTAAVVARLLTEELEGFGQLFRTISFQQIGAAAMLSRALGGLVVRGEGETFLFAVPGSPGAVQTAVGRLIGPQLAHLLWVREQRS